MKQKMYRKENFTCRCAYSLSHLYTNFLFEKIIKHKGKLPWGPKIFAANHPSTLDPFFMMGIIKEPLHVLLTESVFKIPGLGVLANSAGHISVGQGASRKRALEKAVRLLCKQRNVLIFPEGTVSQNNTELKPFHTGTVRMALKTKRPIVPVGIYLDPKKIHQEKAIIKGRPEVIDWYRHGPYVVTFGQPYYLFGQESDRQFVVQQTIILQSKLHALYDQSRLAYYQKNQVWRKRKEVLEQKIAWVTHQKLLPTYSPQYIRPIVALLTFWNKASEFLAQQKLF